MMYAILFDSKEVVKYIIKLYNFDIDLALEMATQFGIVYINKIMT